MKLSVQQIVIITTLSLMFILVDFPYLSLFALAQESTLFEISLTSQSDYAVSGDILAYTVTATNTSQTSINNVFVKIKIPAGTTFADTQYTNPKWFGGKPSPGTRVEEIFWFTPEAIAPGEAATFELMVKVLPEFAEQQIINEGYSVTRAENNQERLIAFGPPVITPIVAATPPLIETAAHSTAVATSIPAPDLALEITEAALTPAPALVPPSASLAVTEVAEPILNSAPQSVIAMQPSSSMLFITTGIFLMIILVIGLTWFFKYR